MPCKKKKTNKKRTSHRRSENDAQRKKYARGGRIEAYTFGETLRKKKDKIWG